MVFDYGELTRLVRASPKIQVAPVPDELTYPAYLQMRDAMDADQAASQLLSHIWRDAYGLL